MNAGKPAKAMPAGSKVFLPDQAERKRRIESRLLEVFARWGFRQIVTPAFDLYSPENGGQVRDTQTFRLVDMDSGGMLALRSDVTPQIARLAGTMLAGRPRPLRLSYVTNVFRHAHVAGVLQREYWQAGVELIGLVSLEADVEMIAIAVECMEENGVENIRMSLSHSAFIRGILDGLRLEEGRRREVLEAVSRRAAKELIQVERLLEFYGLADRVVFDLSDFRNFDYYTGVLFEGFVEGSGYPVCGGGRYDRLLGRYGTDGLGTGIAIDIDQLLEVAPSGGTEGLGGDFLVIDFTREKKTGIRVARELRARGWRVARDIIRRDLADSLAYARSAGIPRCVVVEGGGGKKVRVLDPSGKETESFRPDDISGWIGGVGSRL